MTDNSRPLKAILLTVVMLGAPIAAPTTVAGVSTGSGNTSTATPTDSATPTSTETPTDTATATPKPSSETGPERKIAPGLSKKLDTGTSGGAGTQGTGSGSSGSVSIVVHAVEGETALAESALASNGGTVETTYDGRVYGSLPGSSVTGLAKSPAVKHVRSPATVSAGTHGETSTEGSVTTNATDLHVANVNGGASTVAIIDTRFNPDNSEISDQVLATRDFRGNGFSSGTGGLHGTATAEIVADMAPGANLILVAIRDESDFQQAADYIDQKTDTDVVSMSLNFYPTVGPLDGSDTISQRINDSVDNEETLWSVSAGNEGETTVDHEGVNGISVGRHWNGTWSDPKQNDGLAFDPGTGDYKLDFIADDGASGSVYVTWNESGEEDVQQYNVSMTFPAGSSCSDVLNQSTTGNEHTVRFTLDNDSTLIDCDGSIRIEELSGDPVEPSQEFDVFTRDGLYLNDEYTVTRNLMIPATSGGVVTVGAYDVFEGDISIRSIASTPDYSSQGPTIDGRTGVDIAAPTNVTTTAYSNPFSGTSASAPHVAGAAAIINDANVRLSGTEIRTKLEDNADGTITGPDIATGAGHLEVFDTYDSMAAYSINRCQFVISDGTYRVNGTVGPSPFGPAGHLNADGPPAHLISSNRSDNYAPAYYVADGLSSDSHPTSATTLDQNASDCVTVLHNDVTVTGTHGGTVVGPDYADQIIGNESAIAIGGPQETVLGETIRSGTPISNVEISDLQVRGGKFGIRSNPWIIPIGNYPGAPASTRERIHFTREPRIFGLHDIYGAASPHAASNIDLKNVTVTEATHGVVLLDATDVSLTESDVKAAPDGVMFEGFSNVDIEDSNVTSTERGTGLYLYDGNDATVRYSDVVSNFKTGLWTRDTTDVDVNHTRVNGLVGGLVADEDNAPVNGTNVSFRKVPEHAKNVTAINSTNITAQDVVVGLTSIGLNGHDQDQKRQLTGLFNISDAAEIYDSIATTGPELDLTVPYPPDDEFRLIADESADIRYHEYDDGAKSWSSFGPAPDPTNNNISETFNSPRINSYEDFGVFGAITWSLKVETIDANTNKRLNTTVEIYNMTSGSVEEELSTGEDGVVRFNLADDKYNVTASRSGYDSSNTFVTNPRSSDPATKLSLTPSGGGGGSPGGGGGGGGGGFGGGGGASAPALSVHHQESSTVLSVGNPRPGHDFTRGFIGNTPSAGGLSLRGLSGTLTTRHDFNIEIQLFEDRSETRIETPLPTGPSLGYLQVDTNGNRINDAGFTFTVSKQTLRNESIHPLDVVVYRFDGTEWQSFDPYPQNTEGNYVRYEVKTSSSFSTWAIGGASTSTATPTLTPSPTRTPTLEPTPTAIPTDDLNEPDPQRAEQQDPAETTRPPATPTPTVPPATGGSPTGNQSATTTSATGPGFGTALALFALSLTGAFLARRQRER